MLTKVDQPLKPMLTRCECMQGQCDYYPVALRSAKKSLHTMYELVNNSSIGNSVVRGD